MTDDRPPAPTYLSWQSPLVGLAVVVTIGFFGVLFAMLFLRGVDPSIRDAFMLMLGALMSNFTAVMQYFFGSSSGSANKDTAINNLTKTASVVADTAQATQAAALAPATPPGPILAGDVAIQADTVTVDSPKGKP